MKTRFLALAALVLGLASCQTEPEGLNVNVGGEQDVTISVSLPETTRANSEDGAFDNVDLSGDATIRYIMKIYDQNNRPSDVRYVKYSDGNTVTFDVRLVPNRDYNFVVWADIVDGEDDTDKHYNTTDLTKITLNDTWVAMDETRDAFTGVKFIKQYNGASRIDVELTRPFAKLRVLTTDMADLRNLGITPTTATVEYSVPHYNAFNALEGKAIGDSKNRNIKHENINLFDENGVLKYEEGTLFVDYFFANSDVVKFNMSVYDQYTALINKEHVFNTDIAAKRNHLTTIKGNILTEANQVEVEVVENGAFANENIYIEGDFTLTEDMVVDRPVVVRAGASAVIDLNGFNIINTTESEVFGEGEGIIAYGELTIKGEGTVKGNTMAVWARGNEGAVVNIYGGTYEGCAEGYAKGGRSVIYASSGNVVNIYGGTFKALSVDTTSYGRASAQGGLYAALNVADNNGMINVYGGSFYKQNPAAPLSEPIAWDTTHPNGFVAEGYISVSNDDFYNVIPGTYAATQDDILSALTNTDVDAILMGANVDVTSYDTVMVENNIFVYAEGKTITAGADNMGSNAALVPSFAVMSEYNVTLDKANIVGGGVFACYGANLEINGGSLTYKEGASGRQCYYAASNTDKQAIITIKDVDVNMSNAHGNSYICAHGNAVVYIEGGNFYGKGVRASNAPIKVVSQWGYTAKVIISGGTFDFDPSSDYIGSNNKVYAPQATIATGYKVVNNNNGTWSVVAE